MASHLDIWALILKRKYLLSLTLLLAVTIVASGWGLLREYHTFLVLRGTANQRIASIIASGKNPPVPLSARNVRELTTTCAVLQHEAPLLKREPAMRAKFSDVCAQIASALLDTAPTNARALAMKLMMTDSLTPSALAQAQSAAPDEPGPLRMRINALSYVKAPSAALLDAAQPDFRRAMQSRWGRQLLARLYAGRADLRPELAKAAEASSPEVQKDFVAAVKRASQPMRISDG